jgi:hypothetical protein
VYLSRHRFPAAGRYQSGVISSNDNVAGETMTTEDQLTIGERLEHLRKRRTRYVKTNRRERGHLLDEMEAVAALIGRA